MYCLASSSPFGLSNSVSAKLSSFPNIIACASSLIVSPSLID
nr:MAG TPA: hypothetical protein [Caudoviricetes sp.]